MLLFPAPYPDNENEREGRAQRIQAIDDLFADKKRVYIDVSFNRNIIPSYKKLNDRVSVYKLNTFIHSLFIILLGLAAKKIYIHTQGLAFRVFYLYSLFNRKIITDIHGIAPEEAILCGSIYSPGELNMFEKFMVKNSSSIVVVSNAMKKHFCKKYSLADEKVLILPIFENNPVGRVNKPPVNKPSVIYAGGVHAWQNVDIMLDSMINITDKYEFTIFSNNLNAFRSKLSGRNMLEKVKLLSVSRKEIFDHYKNADFGYILRDDIAVNKVACPTKLVEYMSNGIIPVVLQPNVGDFNELGYSYITLDNLKSNSIPSNDEILEMRENNYGIIEKLYSDVKSFKKELVIKVMDGCVFKV